ncbi:MULTISPECIES: cob(I)yrinic acid a,c-diamide adenosyltransferase [Clostridia]|jgi:ATP:cob(I)alamin adenosyltransferase|uniref:cob(I)yrinic acid a,c-diamide adenosyltransferase n=1 Tax=Clostridia TaxID=186801 RepID=UPI000E554849|nr:MULTISPECIES: cob(I)yrinic acid a,c-diamide adenosyltransferase [Clostridia]MCJ7862279.1 cob(I)yrinic acid a,c-diamide adenosyltransferase [Blautia sp. NSJ-157]MCJ7863083.1 cob(I)yrinic acid a,c-diamide adenosyltransferase [Blautia sp. NSJ-140]QCU02595.1 cob(I)yrinic acid a,c-diamide adenosyltransferase [Blautia sp. SC05B48]RHR09884.1 cob(I)yrinic acid a,c-diamide adenosyltransferase [Ruminococcus sp. AF20-12LB]
MEVYTGYGDKGMTDLSHTKNVSKSDDRICLMGSVEELMSHIGLVRVLVDDVDVVRMLEKISETLKKIIDGVSDPYNREFKVSEDRTELLEEEIGRMKEIFSGERLPILPGDSRVAAEVDVTRAVARRAERELALVSVKFGSDTGAKKYMNRLSDYFYVLARYVDAAKIKEKNEASEGVQGAAKSETTGTEANVVTEAAGTVGNSADVVAGTSAVDVGAQEPQMVQKSAVQAFNAQNGTVTTTAGGNTAMAQNDSMAANTAMIQEVLKRMGIQGRITLDSAKRLIERIEQEALRRNKPSVIAVCSPDGNPVAVHVMDGSFLVSFDMAVKKAYTSVAVKMSTMELSRLTQPGQTFYGLGKMSDNIVIFGGGVPLKVGDTIIGGLGISGGTGEEDNSLAEYGLQVLNEVL